MSECETVSVSEWVAGAAGRAVKVRTPHKDVGNKYGIPSLGLM